MKFMPAALPGVFLVEWEPKTDERGFFARVFCQDEFAKNGLFHAIAQSSLSHNEKKGTLRGMHYQKEPHGEHKLIHCLSGSVYDVLLDLRKGSPTYLKWMSFELRGSGHIMLYVPPGFAHGYQTLEAETRLLYHISTPFREEAAAGVRWNDPKFGIVWPETKHRILSERDRSYPDFA